ncbi:MAG: metallophosphoesterase family protein [Pseudomonadota bacterium]
MRFIHTSDWQLGKPFGRAPEGARNALQEARLDAIDAIAGAARLDGVDLVLVAGDVFDSSEPGDRVFRQALTRMKAAPDVRWVLLPGNHDPARADGLWSRLAGEAPPNVLTCVEPVPLQLSEAAWVLPAPLQFKRGLEDPTAWFDLAETPPGARRIGLAHGSIRNFSSSTETTNLLAPDRAKKAGLDYFALGDWHGRVEVDPFTHYSGTPEPDDFGRAITGLALLVELRSGGAPPEVRELKIGRHGWEEAAWTLSTQEDLDHFLEELAPGTPRKDLVARLRLSGVVTLADRVTILGRLEAELANEIRWLDLYAGDLFARPTDHDLADIDANGVLREAAEQLQAMSAEGGIEGRRAAAALERLYVEHQRAQRMGGA